MNSTSQTAVITAFARGPWTHHIKACKAGAFLSRRRLGAKNNNKKKRMGSYWQRKKTHPHTHTHTSLCTHCHLNGAAGVWQLEGEGHAVTGVSAAGAPDQQKETNNGVRVQTSTGYTTTNVFIIQQFQLATQKLTLWCTHVQQSHWWKANAGDKKGKDNPCLKFHGNSIILKKSL